MKKRNNKVIVLALAGVIFVSLLVVFILNYSKDDSSFSILEKKWINDNASSVIDVSIYNDIPIYGKNGSGVSFDLLDSFSEKYGINFNKVSYLVNDSTSFKDSAFHVVDSNASISKNDILLYEDKYVLISNKNDSVDKIEDITNMNVLVLSSDIGIVSNYLSDAKNVAFTSKEKIDDIVTDMKKDDKCFAVIPYNMYVDYILENNFNILFHFNDIYKKYVLTINDKTFLNIMKKFYNLYGKDSQVDSYKKHFLAEYFLDKKISDVDKIGYNSSQYIVGYIDYMPYSGGESSEFVGTLSNYLSSFEDIYDVDFKLYRYNSVNELKTALSHGEVDLAFANFNTKNMNIDIINTPSLFEEKYVILSKDKFTADSIKSLKGKDVTTINGTFIDDLLTSNGIKYTLYDNSSELIKHIGNNIVVIDKDMYEYYRNTKFSDFYEIYTGTLNADYTFVIRDVNKNKVFADMFSYYVSTVSYNTIRYDYNINSNVHDFNLLLIFLISVVLVLGIFALIIIIKKKKNNEKVLKNNEKLKYVDAMTSLKNRLYLNCKIKEWDDNVIYPQAFVVIDLNNLKDINDSHGHEEGDIIIKKAASILIVNQEPNTDVIRTDGNEFLIYMVGYSEKDVVNYTRRIYKELKELPYGFGASVGYSMIMDDVKTVDDAINEAILDMKNNKKNSK